MIRPRSALSKATATFSHRLGSRLPVETTFDVYGHLLPGSRAEVRKRMDDYLRGDNQLS